MPQALAEALHAPLTEFLLVLLVLMVGPLAAQRLRLPGIVGLILGGFVIGPHGLGIASAHGAASVLGDLGLLVLMFMAGLELDLRLFVRMRRHALIFGLLTFACPFALGLGCAVAVGFTGAAAVLIGSFWASHTLVTYPIAQREGLTTTVPVTTAVGATVITDTLALTVLAVISAMYGTSGGGAISLVALVVGFGVLGGVSFVVMPRVARFWFRGPGRDAPQRWLFVLACCYFGAAVSSAFGIDAIVGAFFAGLGMNRDVLRGSQLAERFEFAGSTLFIPMFLVSVGLTLDPTVMAERSTLKLAMVFVGAVLVGKTLAAVIAGRIERWSLAETGFVVALTVPQAAATLAATRVGANLHLYDAKVENAVLVVVVVSLVVASFLASATSERIPKPEKEKKPLGRKILLAARREDDPAAIPKTAIAVAARIAAHDSGTVDVVQVTPVDAEPVSAKARADAVQAAVAAEGAEGEPLVRANDDVVRALRGVTILQEASLLVLSLPRGLRGDDHGVLESLLGSSTVPLLAVRGVTPAKDARVVLTCDPATHRVARRVARAIGGDALVAIGDAGGTSVPDTIESGDVVIVALPPEPLAAARVIAPFASREDITVIAVLEPRPAEPARQVTPFGTALEPSLTPGWNAPLPAERLPPPEARR